MLNRLIKFRIPLREKVESDPLISKAIWGFNGSECLRALYPSVLVKRPNKRLNLKKEMPMKNY